jgi:hypothetical protein
MSSAADPNTYLDRLGAPRLPARTVPFDPGYDAVTVEAHCRQSGHLMPAVKLSMASWLLAEWSQTKCKIDAAHRAGVTGRHRRRATRNRRRKGHAG